MGMSGHASGEAVVGVTIAMVALAGVVVLLRLFTRIFIVKSPGLDDGFITASLLFSIATTVTMCLQVHWGMSRHMSTLTLHEGIESQKPFYVSVWVYNLAMGCTKYSILLQYLRIFPQKRFRQATFVMLGVNTVYLLWTTLSAIFACWPIPYFWEQVDPRHAGEGECLQRFAVWFANAALNITTDIAIGLLPLPVLSHLQLPNRQRIALMVVFGLGGFTCLISILRLQSLYVISRAKDITWENPLAAIWSSVEVNTGILCSCLPTLKAAFSRFAPGLFGSSHASASTSAGTEDQARRGGRGPRHTRRQSTLSTTLKRTSKKLSFDALGRGLSGRGEPTQCSTISGSTTLGTGTGTGTGTWTSKTDMSSFAGGHNDDFVMKDFEGTQTGTGCSGEWDRGIQVVTTVEQDVENISAYGSEYRWEYRHGYGGMRKEKERDVDRGGDRDRDGSEASSQKELFG